MQLRLIKARVKNGEVAEDLAPILGISPSSYRSKENGRTEFKLSEMFKLASYYNMKIDDLFIPNFMSHERKKQDAR